MSLSQWAPLFSYPGEDYHVRVGECGNSLAEFARVIEGVPIETLQELFTQTFDWNPATTLDIGWHLFWENYDRCDFLVKLRGALKTHDIAESRELPDHLSHVLLLIDRMPEQERAEFLTEYVVPAVEKLREGLAKTRSPFLPLVIALQRQFASLLSKPVLAGVNHE